MDKNQKEIQINNLSVAFLRLSRASNRNYANIGYHSLETLHNWRKNSDTRDDLGRHNEKLLRTNDLKTRYLFDIYENLDGCSNANGFFKTSTQSIHQLVWLSEIEANSINEIRASKTKIKLN